MVFQEKVSWKSLPPKRPQTTPPMGGQLHPVQPPQKAGVRHNCNRYFLLRDQRTSRNWWCYYSSWMGDLYRKAPLLLEVITGLQPSTREVLPFQFLTIHQPTALSNVARALFPASWPNST